MSIISLTKETTGGATIIQDGTERFFSANTAADFTIKGNSLVIEIGRYTYKLSTTDTITINAGSGAAVFSGTIAQLKAAAIPVFPKANTSAGGTGTTDLSGYSTTAQVDTKDAAVLSTIRGGVVTAGDNLSKLYALIQTLNTLVSGTTPDGDSVTNTVQEILSVFSTYPEGTDIATLLSSKLPTASFTAAAINALYGYTPANPAAIPTALGQLTDDITHRLTTDAEKATWNNKATSIPLYKQVAQKIYQNALDKAALPAAMASGPTISVSATSALIGTTVPYSDAAFQYSSTAVNIVNSLVYAWHVDRGGYKTGGHFDVHFCTDATAFEIITNATDNLRVFVDGLAASLSVTPLGSSFATTYVKVDFGASSSPRVIRLEIGMAAPFGGVKIPANYSVWSSGMIAPIRGMICGDSYTESAYGDGSFNRILGLGRLVGYRLGINDWFNSGKAGENYSAFATRATTDVIPYAPNYLIVCEGINDVNTNTTTLQTTVTNLYASLLSSLPNTIITVIGPWRAPTLNPGAAVNTAISNGVAAQTAAVASGRIKYIDTFAEVWQSTGAGRVGTTSGSGNSNIYVGADGTHLVQAGYDYLSERIYTAAMRHLSSILP